LKFDHVGIPTTESFPGEIPLPPDIEIARVADEAAVMELTPLFDGPAVAEHVRTFLADDRHHLLVAREGGSPVGFVTGVEMTHPDKGTEMFLYELAVGDAYQRRGIGRALVEALAALGRDRGCYGMWVLTDRPNTAAVATYLSAGGADAGDQVMIDWSFSQE
jgi:ribosomal protein S18 acetylase RimI-like enzyme